MSRILDALRRAEVERSGKGTTPPEIVEHVPDLLLSIEEPVADHRDVRTVQYRPRPDHHLVVYGPNHTAGAENFRLLRYRLDALRGRKRLISVVVASAIPGEGKTTVATNLAATLAFVSKNVLLVDADMRKGGNRTALGMGPLAGLSDLLEDRINLQAALRRVEPLGFYYLSAGRTRANPVELLQSVRMRELMKETATGFDWVVVDSPPLIPFADGLCLASLSDAILMVVREGFTPRQDFQAALASLKGAALAGVVVNQSEFFDQSSYYSYYRHSGPAKTAAMGELLQRLVRLAGRRIRGAAL